MYEEIRDGQVYRMDEEIRNEQVYRMDEEIRTDHVYLLDKNQQGHMRDRDTTGADLHRNAERDERCEERGWGVGG